CSRGYPTDRLSGRSATSSRPSPDSVLLVVREVGMRGPVLLLQLVVILRPCVLVANHHGDRRAEAEAVLDPAENLDDVRFFALGDDPRWPRPAAVQLKLDLVQGNRKARRAAIHYHSHTTAMRFAPGGDPEQRAERAGHARESI